MQALCDTMAALPPPAALPALLLKITSKDRCIAPALGPGVSSGCFVLEHSCDEVLQAGRLVLAGWEQ